MASRTRYRTAVALQYGVEEVAAEAAPRVVVSGDGASADDIVATARRFGVPVVEDGAVARALRRVPLEGVVPPALYEIVAIILNKLESLTPPTQAARR